MATVCIDGVCQIPCYGDFPDVKAPHLCSLGETCVQGVSGQGPTYYCQPVSFSMDLNLLDSCIVHFLGGLQPDLSSQNPCSLEQNLNQMLDQDGSGTFNIFDVDGCIRAFLAAEPCDVNTQTCADGQVYCDQNDECGEGLFCEPDLHRCQRECGFISSREQGEIETLERQCFGHLKVCNYSRGRCVPVDLEGATCSVDSECPTGAYCFLGYCQPRCYRSIDCPDSNWYCSTNNTCLPRPGPDAGQGGEFNPNDYSVQLARKSFTLTPINNEYRIPLLVMSLETRKQVFDDPNVVFGYRLEVKYARKQDPKCFRPPEQWTEEEREDCLIDDTEEFITLQNPFGTVYATGDPTLDLGLNQAAVDRLSPGSYEASITAIFNNGSQDSATVKFHKTSLSGEYTGRLSIYIEGPENFFGNSDVSMRLFVDTDAPFIQWYELLEDENLDIEQDIVDITAGYPISGYIHGNQGVVFNLPAALNRAENEIPVKGIYSPHLARMRLITAVDIEANHCRSENGECDDQDQDELKVANVFGRKIRRLIQFIGPFDETARLFHGMYRETISGVLPFDVTIDGGFRLKQTTADETPVVLPDNLLPDGAEAVGFPDQTALLVDLAGEDGEGGEIAAYCHCQDCPEATQHFDDENSYQAYMANFDNEFDNGPILPDLTTFSDLIEDALNSMNNDGSLTIFEFLRDNGDIHLCSEESDENCIDENKVRCGLALYRKAILSNWVDLGDIGQGEHELFCTNCGTNASDDPTLVTLQEHNRFYKEYTQTIKYQAGSDLTEAFYVLYRAGPDSGGLGGAEAIDYKKGYLMDAWHSYDKLRAEFFSPSSTAVLANWPMRSFEMAGDPWLGQMHGVLQDRMDALAEIIDLKRRILLTADGQDFLFVQHLMHLEYLSQVFLATLQHHWQRELFSYRGNGVQMIEKAGKIIAQVNETRNPLGLQANRIFFENSDLGMNNWENYNSKVQAGIATTQNTIENAVQQLMGALQNRNTFEGSILRAQHQHQQIIDELCGPADENAYPPECDIGEEEREIEQECVGSGCAFEYNCESEECDEVVQVFNDATGEGFGELACRLNDMRVQIQVGPTTRNCIRGQMGALLQESVLLKLQRRQIFRKINALLRQIASQNRFIQETIEADEALIEYLNEHNLEMIGIQELIIAAEYAYETVMAAASAVDCWTIAGTAAGTNCPQRIAAAALVEGAAATRYGIISQLAVLKESFMRLKEIHLTEYSQQAELRRQRMILDNLVTEVENFISEYEMVVQQLFNLDMRIKDTHFLAQQAANRYSEQLESLVDHLVGMSPGNVLMRNQYVSRANAEFRKLLIDTYKMTMAFIHYYNRNEDAEQLMNSVFQILTLGQVNDHLNYLLDQEESYCGASHLDCDWVLNHEQFRFSVRDELFPNLRDVVDSKTGKVLTKGQQFHNLITSSTFLKRRLRGEYLVDQIEIPFTIWANDRGDAGGALQQWMLPQMECNHMVVSVPDGVNNGTIAVNLIGTRLNQPLKYELRRGNMDYLRACDMEEVMPPGGGMPILTRPINTYLIGYPGEDGIDGPSFETRTMSLTACRNASESQNIPGHLAEAECFKAFARDRSLAAPDWKLVIPVSFDDNEWILGEGLPGHEKPMIEDINLYFRYRARPTAD